MGRRLPRSTAEIHGDQVRLTVEVAAVWPTPLTGLVDEIRATVRQMVESSCGLHVQVLDVNIAKVERIREAAVRRVL
jgi:hypothetical protein